MEKCDMVRKSHFKKILVAVDENSLSVPIILSPDNHHDSTKLIDVVKNLDCSLDDSAIQQINKVYADKGYYAKYIRKYLTDRKIKDCIPHRTNSKTILQNNEQNSYNKTGYVVERIFA